MESERVKILSAKYDKFRKIVVWKIQKLSDDSIKDIAFYASDLGPAVGIKKEIPEVALIKFLDMLINKEVNWVAQQDQDTLLTAEEKKALLDDAKKPEIESDKKSAEVLEKKIKALESYPFDEVDQYGKSSFFKRR